jgi:FMN-dependent oxidoreductase (nitrilotriacetate monooxygenase family)
MTTKHFKLGYSMRSMGYHVAAWRLPDQNPDAAINLSAYQELVREAEAAKLDMVFLADTFSPKAVDEPPGCASRCSWNAEFEPTTLLAALAVTTRHIGLIATASTTYEQPYHLARRFSSLDHLSGGRAGWNMVTSWNAKDAANFHSGEVASYEDRYARGREFMEVCRKLWESWEDDALVMDQGTGIFYDEGKVRPVHHKGEHFSVAGPLTLPRTPQGRPVIVQAGSSDEGRDIAAESADVIYTNAATLEEAQEFYADMKRRAAVKGRDPEKLLIMSGLTPYFGATEAEGQEEYSRLQELTDPIVAGTAVFRKIPNLAKRGLDEVVRPEDFDVMYFKSSAERMRDHALTNKLTLRKMLQIFGTGTIENVAVGSAKQVADHMEHWHSNKGCDGFNIAPPHALSCIRKIRAHLVPELQSRGLFRREYEGTTLRANLGLDWPSTARVASGRALEATQ